MKGIKLSFLFFLVVAIMRPQSDSLLIKSANPTILKRLGKNALLQNDPESAIHFFNAYLKANPTDAATLENLGKAYMQVRNYERAQHVFLIAHRTSKTKAPEALYYHALMQKSNEKYDSAKINFQQFKKEYKGTNKVLKRQSTKEIAFCDSIQKVQAIHAKIVVEHLDNSVNKVNTEGAPFNLDENTLLFTSLRTDGKEYIMEDDSSGGVKRKLYYAERRGDEWHYAGEFGENVNDSKYNISNACFSHDRKRLYFTRCKLNYREKMICAIYVTEKKANGWTEPVKLNKTVNNNKYSSTMPAVANDPVKGNDILYYVSDRKDGKGGLDIWYSVYDKKNKIFKPSKNAGSKINTQQNEISPFFDGETKSLYFSSDGLGGLGGYDVYKANGDGKRWSSVDNIGQPINTGADDIYYTISTNRQEGFFVSNRKGGAALENATCCDDIYYYKKTGYVKMDINGNIHEVLDPSIPIPGACVDVFIKDKLTQEKSLLKTVCSDSLGNFTTSLEADRDYYFVAKKKDYLGSSQDVSTVGLTETKKLDLNMQLIKQPKEAIHVPNIQYEFGRSDMTEDSKKILDSTVLKLMLLNPELIIEIQSHTDNKGSDAYNKKLSQKRAESMASYLIGKGIDPKKIKAMGYGESQPITPNQNADGSDNPEGRAKNRRVTFKIIGVIDAEIINDEGGE